MSPAVYLGIYEEQLNDAETVVELACEMHGIDSDDVWLSVLSECQTLFGDRISNTITEIIFEKLADALVRKGVDEGGIDWYVNGTLDTSFYINGEEIA